MIEVVWEGLQSGDFVEAPGQEHSLKEWVGSYAHVENGSEFWE